MKTSELTGAALDWAVAKCEGETLSQASLAFQIKEHGCLQRPHLGSWKPSTSWAQGGPIIEREKIEIAPWGIDGEWRARDFYEPSPGVPSSEEFGPTPLIAAMRAFVASKLGNEVDVPEELAALVKGE